MAPKILVFNTISPLKETRLLGEEADSRVGAETQSKIALSENKELLPTKLKKKKKKIEALQDKRSPLAKSETM